MPFEATDGPPVGAVELVGTFVDPFELFFVLVLLEVGATKPKRVAVGDSVVGVVVGEKDGAIVGLVLGGAVGAFDVGCSVVGENEGLNEGEALGKSVGMAVGIFVEGATEGA